MMNFFSNLFTLELSEKFSLMHLICTAVVGWVSILTRGSGGSSLWGVEQEKIPRVIKEIIRVALLHLFTKSSRYDS
jgi:hypothetical protein